jgi:hypothetical protein
MRCMACCAGIARISDDLFAIRSLLSGPLVRRPVGGCYILHLKWKPLLGLALCAATDYAAICWAAPGQVSWVKTRGKEGLVVYIFGLKRRAGQAASLSKPVSSRSSSSVRGLERVTECYIQQRKHVAAAAEQRSWTPPLAASFCDIASLIRCTAAAALLLL